MILAWILGIGGWVAAALAAALAYCMAFPVRWDGPGFYGAVMIFYPLHALIFTVPAVILASFSRARGLRPAAWGFGLTALITAGMALLPTAALWRRARELGVPLSLREYVANWHHVNEGDPDTSRTVTYGVAKDGTRLLLDAWRTGLPDSGTPRPTVVFVHGGGWNHGNRSMLPDWDHWLNGLGYEVFDIEYRMSPPVRWLDETGDVKSALGWVVAHAAEYHVDPARITIMGGSAGANLAMLAAYSVGDTLLRPSTDVAPVAVRSVINFYGPTDMARGYRITGSPHYVRPLMAGYIGGTPDEFPDRYRALSPLTYVSASSPPTLTLLGTNDRLVAVDHAVLLDAALRKAGVEHEMVLLPGTDHGFDSNWGAFSTQIARARIREFLRTH